MTRFETNVREHWPDHADVLRIKVAKPFISLRGLLPTLNGQVQWAIIDLATEGAVTRRSGAPVVALALIGSELRVGYGDDVVARFTYNLDDLTPSVRNPHFIGYRLADSGQLHPEVL